MITYHKIQTVFKRDMTNNGKIIEGDYSLPEFEYLKNNNWVFTEKVDGTNIRVMWSGQDVVFSGKTDNAQIPVFLIYKLQELFEGNKKELFKTKFVNKDGSLFGDVCLYGEGYGAKIQKGGGKYIPDGVDFVLFDVNIFGNWLVRKQVEDIANHFGIKIVPIIGEGTLTEAVEKTKEGFKSQWGDFIAEGIVARPSTELKTRRGDRVITKIKYRDFQSELITMGVEPNKEREKILSAYNFTREKRIATKIEACVGTVEFLPSGIDKTVEVKITTEDKNNIGDNP